MTSTALDTNIKVPKFFEGHSYFIDEKVNLFKFENQYKVFNEKGEERRRHLEEERADHGDHFRGIWWNLDRRGSVHWPAPTSGQ